MIHLQLSELVPASCEAVFELVHDYQRRLEWDTLLQSALVVGGGPAREGAVAVCTGKRSVGGLRFETVYVSFKPGVVAAVKLINRPLFFDQWAASIRHEPRAEPRGESPASLVTYTVTFRARPRWLAWLFEPILAVAFRWETRRRLRALKHHFERQARTGS